jgi:hypothetical protein
MIDTSVYSTIFFFLFIEIYLCIYSTNILKMKEFQHLTHFTSSVTMEPRADEEPVPPRRGDGS